MRRHTHLHTQQSVVPQRFVALSSAGISENVKEKPVGVEILGEKVVLYRGVDGTIHCLSDVCPHRGAPLHLG